MRHLVRLPWPTLGLAAGFLLPSAPAHAQSPGAEIEGVPAGPGAAVRLFTIEGTGPVDGVLLPSSAGAWRVRTDDRGIVEVSTDDVMSAELRTTHSQLVPGALIGTAMGLVAGSIYHVARNGDGGGCLVPGAACAGHAAGPSPLTSFVLIPAAGTVLGGLIGSQRQSSQWIPAVLPGRDGSWDAAWSLEWGG